MIVSRHRETDPAIAADHIIARDFPALAVYFLIDQRLLQHDIAARHAHHQVAPRIDVQFARAANAQRDGLGICSRRHNEVIFQALLASVEEHVHAGINSVITHRSVRRNVRVPLGAIAADEVVRFSRQLLRSGDFRRRVGSVEMHAQRGGSPRDVRLAVRARRQQRCSLRRFRAGVGWLAQSKYRFLVRQEQLVTLAVRQIANFGGRLALVGFERERQCAVRARQILLLRGGKRRRGLHRRCHVIARISLR